MKKLIGLIIVATLLIANGAFAVGIADFVSAGINVVGKVGGAMIDKAMEDSPEEMARKQEKEKLDREAKFQEVIAKIETRKDVTPLEKEKLTRAAARTFGAAETISNLAVQQELQRRAERDQMFTAGGIAGVVGGAAMNTPSAVMAKADIMVKTGVPQAQSRDALARADVLMKTGHPQAQSRAAVDAATVAMNGGKVDAPAVGNVELGGSAQDKAMAREGVLGAIAQNQGEIDKAKAAIEAAKPAALPATSPQVSNLAALDKGHKVYVEFVDSKQLTERLVQAFRANGYEVVASEAEAEAVYQFDAEYAIAEEASREGTLVRVGKYVEEGSQPIELKAKGASMKQMAAGFLFAMGGKELPKQQDSGLYRQAALFVANRHADGKDMRVAARSSADTYELAPMKLIEGVFIDLMDLVGVPGKSQVVAANDPSGLAKKDRLER